MAEITLPSGRIANIRIADFHDGMKLQNAIVKEAAREGVKELDIKNLLNAATSGKIMEANIDMGAIVMATIGAATSENVYSTLWPCLKQSSIGGERITESSFDLEEHRGDFYPIAIECVKVNLRPFWMALLSELGGVAEKLQ